MKKLIITLTLLSLSLTGCKISYKKSHLAPGEVVTSGIFLNAKVCLEGPYGAGPLMDTTINVDSYLPTLTPYANTAPWFHYSMNDNTVLTQDVQDAYDLGVFVDWVVVEVYKFENGVYNYYDGQSALVHQDGTLYDSFGIQGISFPSLDTGSYYINILHRNHLSIASDDPVTLNGSFAAATYNIDFTNPATNYYDPLASNPFTTIGGVKCMAAGDLNGDLSIDAADEAEVDTAISDVVAGYIPGNDVSILGYRNSDVNMDGQTNSPGAAVTLDVPLIQGNNGKQGSIY